ncbi:MAG: NAD(+) synthase, partial [Eggerthellaceae bacterium]|nr:NAD(+) synthase [Eggerthellaceae bacterium]
MSWGSGERGGEEPKVLAEEKYRHCCRALKDFAQQAGFAEVVFGLSGGIDSALVALMCVDAFGADKVHAVLLPGPFTSAASVDDAQELADRLGIALSTISITEAFQAFKQAFVDAGLSPLEASAAENTQARCRMICLMALSNMHRWMLVNTGNKSELLVGYSTMYGDMAGAFAPLGCLYKTEVYELSRWRNACEAKMGWPALISASILEKAPSAELAADQ